MWSGVWPPSNQGGIEPPARAFWPFVPRPARLALARGDAAPTRVLRVCDPGAGPQVVQLHDVVFSWPSDAVRRSPRR
jgi:hypothetical protein